MLLFIICWAFTDTFFKAVLLWLVLSMLFE